MTTVVAPDEGRRPRGILGDDWQPHRAPPHARADQEDERRWMPGSVLAGLLAAGRVPLDGWNGPGQVLTEEAARWN
ncbi:MAG TPA: hypothetical protein VGD53_12575 [Actinoallomurus sp.]|jgi:hypothetical protein